MEEKNEKGFKKGNKPQLLRKIYDGKGSKEEISKQELRSNAVVKFISNNINMRKWCHDSHIRKEDWKTTGKRLTKYILDNRERAVIQITKFMEGDDMKRAMNVIRRVLMQINQCNRDTDMEKEIQECQCYLGMLAL
jgi:hypothetical protein